MKNIPKMVFKKIKFVKDSRKPNKNIYKQVQNSKIDLQSKAGCKRGIFFVLNYSAGIFLRFPLQLNKT